MHENNNETADKSMTKKPNAKDNNPRCTQNAEVNNLIIELTLLF